jgi:tungstate transport system substrate-binding protein
MRRATAAAAMFLAAFAACKRAEEKRPVHVVTTPEVLSSGLVQHLVDVFARQSNVRVELRGVPSAQLVQSAADADVVVAGDAATAQALRQGGKARLLNTFAFDDFVIAGPSRDPAHVRRAGSAPEAFRNVASRRRAFCAPVDVAPLRGRELEIWSAAGVDPHRNKRYRHCRGDAAAVLAESERREAYTLVDRATAENARLSKLKVLMSGTPMLRDPFTIVLIRQAKPYKDAEWLVEWVMSFRGREVVQSFAASGGRRFYVAER